MLLWYHIWYDRLRLWYHSCEIKVAWSSMQNIWYHPRSTYDIIEMTVPVFQMWSTDSALAGPDWVRRHCHWQTDIQVWRWYSGTTATGGCWLRTSSWIMLAPQDSWQVPVLKALAPLAKDSKQVYWDLSPLILLAQGIIGWVSVPLTLSGASRDQGSWRRLGGPCWTAGQGARSESYQSLDWLSFRKLSRLAKKETDTSCWAVPAITGMRQQIDTIKPTSQ